MKKNAGAVRVEIVDAAVGRVAVLTIDFPPINAGSQAMRTALLAAFQGLQTSGLAGVVLRGAGTNFVGGADIREFDHAPQEPHLPEVIAAIENCPVPVVAALDGAALGGGYEIALGCDGRVATKKAVVGLPEVTLGLVPGGGGSLRLPRIVGQVQGIELITSGRRVKSDEAVELGMVDMVAEGDLTAAAINYLAGMRGKRLLRDLPVPEEDRVAIDAAAATALKAARGASAVPEAIVVIRESAELPVDVALQKERARSLRLRLEPQSKALRHLFFAERQTGRIDGNPAPLPVKKVGVVGAGRMGQGIALAFARAGYAVHLAERDADALHAGLAAIGVEVEKLEARGKLSSGKALITRISGGALEEMADCDLVVEAVFEDMEVKKSLLSALEAVVSPKAILTTNTSYLDIDEMAKGLSHPERLGGLHFFNPAHVMRLLEVVRTSCVDERVLATLVSVAKSLRKVPVIARVGEGFIGNRIFSAYRQQCEFLLEEGSSPADIDSAMREFGMAMGPFAVFDLAGLDIAWAQRKRLAPHRDPEMRYVDVADRLCEAGRFGRKTGRGWYDYSANLQGAPDPFVAELVLASATSNGVTRREISVEDIQWRLLATMVNVAAEILAEGIAERPSDIDLVLVHGYGFPKLKGGPLHWAAQQDRKHVLDAVAQMARASRRGFSVAPNLESVLDAAAAV